MNIYQLQYTRLGRQGIGAGWQVSGGTKGTPQLAVNIFEKLASNLVSARTGAEMPPEVWDIQIQERYVFLSHVNYISKNIGDDTDTRGVSFVHGYVLRAEDFKELVKEPWRAVGFPAELFDKNYEGKRELPLLEELPAEPMDKYEVLASLGLDQEGYRRLMERVYAALSAVGGNVCVCSEKTEQKNFEELAKKIAFLVYDGLPYLFRLKLSVFSYDRQGAFLTFSRKAEGHENVFDLDTGMGYGPEAPGYGFIQACTSLGDEDARRQLLAEMEEFSDITYGGNYEAVRLHHMELACGAVRRDVTPERLDVLMKDAAGVKAYRYDLLDAYLGDLLGVYWRIGKELPGPEIYKKLQRRFVETENQEFRQMFCNYYADHMCLPGNTGAYETMYHFQTERPGDYEYLIRYLEEKRPEFVNAYYFDYYLDRHLDTAARYEEFVSQKNGPLDANVAARIFDILGRLLKKETASVSGNEGLLALTKRYEEYGRIPGAALPDRMAGFSRLLKENYWNHFDVSQFEYSRDQEYAQMGLYDRGMPIPDAVRKLVDGGRMLLESPDLKTFQQTFLSGSVIQDSKKRKALVDELRQIMKAKPGVPLDSYLLANYRGESGFDLHAVATDLRDSDRNMYLHTPDLAGGFLDSRLLNGNGEVLEKFKEQLKALEKENGQGGMALLRNVYLLYFPPMRADDRMMCLWDYVQKWMMFAALMPPVVIGCRVAFQSSQILGIVASVAAGILAVAALALNIRFGETDIKEFFEQNGGVVLAVTAVGAAISAALAVLTALASVPLLIVMAVLSAVLVIARIVLLMKTLYA